MPELFDNDESGNTAPSEAAKELSKLGAAKGGAARASALTPARRKEIATRAVLARWNKSPDIPHAIGEAIVSIGNRDFECAVLENPANPEQPIRVLSERAFSRAIGAKRGGSHWLRKKIDSSGANLPVFLSAKNLRPFISKELGDALSRPIHYIGVGGQIAYGIEATRIVEILDVWLKAREAEKLNRTQVHLAAKAEILMRALAGVGIIALIDEATGYQAVRTRDALAKFLDSFIAKDLRRWVRTFPLDYFKEMCRLKGVAFSANMKLPPYFGHHTNDIVYSRLAPGVLPVLRRKNPRTENGRRKHKHHQWLSEKEGIQALRDHLVAVVTMMKLAPDGGWDGFYANMEKLLPVYQSLPLLEATIERTPGIPVTDISSAKKS